jgi:hypothetical protein
VAGPDRHGLAGAGRPIRRRSGASGLRPGGRVRWRLACSNPAARSSQGRNDSIPPLSGGSGDRRGDVRRSGLGEGCNRDIQSLPLFPVLNGVAAPHSCDASDAARRRCLSSMLATAS